MNFFKMILSSILFTPLLALAQEAHEATHEAAHGAHGAHDVVIPWTSLGVQAFNVIFLFALLFWLLRKTAVAHFANRAKEYNELVSRAAAAKAEAERGHQEIKGRLDKLESGAEQGLIQARKEAEELKNRMISEAKAVAERLQTEAKRSIATEVEKAKAELRVDLLQSALATSQEVLKSSLSSSEQKKLQNEFVTKIQVVGG